MSYLTLLYLGASLVLGSSGLPDCCEVKDEDLRLVDGTADFNGRVEVYYNNTWGTICGHNFDRVDADFICKKLGFEHGVSEIRRNAFFGQGSGPIWLDNLECHEYTTNIASCRSQDWGEHDNCDHTQDVGLICKADGTVRLINQGRNHPNAGRVEVFHDDSWGTIGDNGFDIYAANLICHLLGLDGADKFHHDADPFGEGSGIVWLDNLRCTAYTTNLDSCRSEDWGCADCDHSNDTGVTCVANGSIRLVDGTTPSRSSGRVEVYNEGKWGTICDNSFDIDAGNTVCKALGFSGGAAQVHSGASPFGPGTGDILFDELWCPTNAGDINSKSRYPYVIADIADCEWRRSADIASCTNDQDAGVTCVEDGVFKLAEGNPGTEPEGRVEVFYSGRWGTVCDDFFGSDEANMVCRSLGYDGSSKVYQRAHFGQGSHRIWLTRLECQLDAASLDDKDPDTDEPLCEHDDWGDTTCTHKEDVGIQCYTTGKNNQGLMPIPTLQRSTGSKWMQGRLGNRNPSSVPRRPMRRRADSSATDESDTDVSDADLEGTKPDGALRLENGRGRKGRGRVEVSYGGTWGTICDDSFGLYEAHVICRELGFTGAVEAHSEAYFGEGSGPILLDDLACSEESRDLSSCMKLDWGRHNCAHSEDAGVTCALPGQEVAEVTEWGKKKND